MPKIYNQMMKIKNLLLLGVLPVISSSCSSWVRIGDLNAISNRNLDDSKQYVLLNREVEAEADSDNDALEQAIDNLTKKHEGEFIRNAKIFVKDNGKKIKVTGDVWGTRNTQVNVNTIANAKIQLNIGDTVVFKRKGELIEGQILGINSNLLIIQYGKGKKEELKYDEVTKTNK